MTPPLPADLAARVEAAVKPFIGLTATHPWMETALGQTFLAVEALAQDLAAAERQKRVVLCVYCGGVIHEFTAPAAEVTDTELQSAVDKTVAHDRRCTRNPLRELARVHYRDLVTIIDYLAQTGDTAGLVPIVRQMCTAVVDTGCLP